MRCPACKTDRAHTIVTQPSDHREDGRVYRRKRCKNPTCKNEFTTFEMLVSEVKALESTGAPQGGWTKPLPSSPTGALVDIEAELEELLEPSIRCIEETLTSGEASDRGKLDTARWLIDDRREYRKSLAESNPEGTSDPAVAELAKILSIVPSEESA